MKTDQAILLAGSPSALARILDISTAAVSQWGEFVPRLRVYQLRELRPEWFMEGKKRKPAAESESLRPDVDWAAVRMKRTPRKDAVAAA